MDVAATLTLQQLKDLLFEREFLVAIDEEEGLAHDVFKLLDALALHEHHSSIVKYFVDFEAFFTQLVKDLNHHRNVDFQIKTKLNEMRLEWDFSEACEKKLNDFEAKKKERIYRQQAFDQQILDYHPQIAEHNRKIAEVET